MKGGSVTSTDGRAPIERLARGRALRMLNRLEGYLAREFSDGRAQRQLQRFVLALIASLLAGAGADGWSLSWGALWALLPPAVWVGVETAWPSIPWRTVQQYLDSVRVENAHLPMTPPAAERPTSPQDESPPRPPAAHP